MGNISVNNLEPGMVLYEPVKSAEGKILIAAGSEITEKYIRVLKTWGVTTVNIVGNDEGGDSEAAAIDPAEIEKAKEIVKEFFVHNSTEHPLISHLLERRARNSAIENSNGGEQ